MPARKDLSGLGCSLANGVDIFGDRWSLLVLRDVFLGVRRFDEFIRDLGIARNVLSDRLERLVADGVLTTRRYQDRPPRDEYILTEKGTDLLDVLLALWRWGDRWEPGDDDMVQVMTHIPCGEETRGIVVCENCGEKLDRHTIRSRPLLQVVAERRETRDPVASNQ